MYVEIEEKGKPRRAVVTTLVNAWLGSTRYDFEECEFEYHSLRLFFFLDPYIH